MLYLIAKPAINGPRVLLFASAALMVLWSIPAPGQELRGRAEGTESSEVSSTLYTTRLGDSTYSTKLGESSAAGAVGANGEVWGPGAGEKGFANRTSTEAGRVEAYAEYGVGGTPGTARTTTPSQPSGAAQPAAPAREATQTLLRSQTNGLPLGQPGAGTAVGTPKATSTPEQGEGPRPGATPGSGGNR